MYMYIYIHIYIYIYIYGQFYIYTQNQPICGRDIYHVSSPVSYFFQCKLCKKGNFSESSLKYYSYWEFQQFIDNIPNWIANIESPGPTFL